MTTSKYAITMQDGSVRIMTLYEGDVESEYKRWEDGHLVASYVEISEESVPTDRSFRAAWTVTSEDNGKVKLSEDLTKAKDIQLENVRTARATRLEALDKEMMFAIEENDEVKKASVLAQKKFYRDITEELKAANPTTLDEIKDLFPNELKD